MRRRVRGLRREEAEVLVAEGASGTSVPPGAWRLDPHRGKRRCMAGAKVKVRFRSLSLVLLGAACVGDDGPAPVFVADFRERSQQVHCEAAPTVAAGEASVGEVVTVSDTSFLILYPLERRVTLYGPDLAPRWSLTFAEEGPLGVVGPQSVALVGDSLLYVADRPRMVLRVMDRSGADRGTIPVGFPPQRVAASGSVVLIAPLVFGAEPASLLYSLEGGRIREHEVPVTRFADFTVNAFGNLVALAPYAGERVIVAHQFLVPTAYLVSSAGVDRRALPLPAEVRKAVGWVPPMPFREEAFGRIATPVLAAAAERRTGDFLYLTRTGHRQNGVFEKAIVRVDRELRYRRSYVLDVNAGHLAYLAEEGVSVIVDEEDRGYRCLTP